MELVPSQKVNQFISELEKSLAYHHNMTYPYPSIIFEKTCFMNIHCRGALYRRNGKNTEEYNREVYLRSLG